MAFPKASALLSLPCPCARMHLHPQRAPNSVYHLESSSQCAFPGSWVPLLKIKLLVISVLAVPHLEERCSGAASHAQTPRQVHGEPGTSPSLLRRVSAQKPDVPTERRAFSCVSLAHWPPSQVAQATWFRSRSATDCDLGGRLPVQVGTAELTPGKGLHPPVA